MNPFCEQALFTLAVAKAAAECAAFLDRECAGGSRHCRQGRANHHEPASLNRKKRGVGSAPMKMKISCNRTIMIDLNPARNLVVRRRTAGYVWLQSLMVSGTLACLSTRDCVTVQCNLRRAP